MNEKELLERWTKWFDSTDFKSDGTWQSADFLSIFIGFAAALGVPMETAVNVYYQQAVPAGRF